MDANIRLYISALIITFETRKRMIGSIVGAGLGAVGSIFGGIKASKAMKKVRNNLREQQQDNANWYNRRYNEDATQRADAQRILTKTEESIRNRNRQAAAAQAVMGGTEESVAAAKSANNEAMAEAASQIAVAADARKDGIEQNFLQREAAINDSLNNLEMGKAQNISTAIGGVVQAGSAIGNAIDDWRENRK